MTPDPPSQANHSVQTRFVATRWTLILRARGETAESRAALSELCDAYYQPVLRFLQREGRDEDTARELAQEFFAEVLAGGAFDGADPARGRFRSYLLGALKHFLFDERKRERRLKRGGGRIVESLDASNPCDADGSASQIADDSARSPEALFDREWALAVVNRGIGTVEKEFVLGGKEAQFCVLKPWLMGDSPSMSQADAARGLGISEGAVKVMIHRVRKRFREAVRADIAQTLREPAPALVDEELQHLIAALS